MEVLFKKWNIFMLQLLKQIFFDVLQLYKNFFNWNAHKILVYSVGAFYAAILIFIFSFIFFLLGKIFWSLQIDFFVLLQHSLFENVYVVASIFAFFLLGNMYFSYINREKLGYFKNCYLDIRLFCKCLIVTFSFIAISMGVLFLYLFIIQYIYGNNVSIIVTDEQQRMQFAIVTMGIAVLMGLLLFYFLYRFGFVFAYLLQERCSLQIAFKQSVLSTKGGKKLIMTIISILLFSLWLLPFSSFEKSLDQESSMLGNYIALQKITVKSPVQTVKFEQYKLRYKDIPDSYIISTYQQLFTIAFIVKIIMFFIFSGYMTMLYISIFKRIIEIKQ